MFLFYYLMTGTTFAALLLAVCGPCADSAPCTIAPPIVIETGTPYSCGDGDSRTKIFYPTGGDVTGSYPVVLFHRGSEGYPGQGYDKWLESVAKQCLIVIIPNTVSGYHDEAACKRDHDLLLALEWAKTNPSRLPTKADWTRIGVMGHSAGAHHLPLFINDAQHRGLDIRAAVFSHGGDDIGEHEDLSGIPSFFLTSMGDSRERTNPEKTYGWFNACASYHKVFANLARGGHGEPHDLYQFAAWTGRFLACHLFPPGVNHPRREETCSRIYGDDSDSIFFDGRLAGNYDLYNVPGCEIRSYRGAIPN